MAETPAGRARFGPTVGLGIASAVLAAVASAKPWFRLDVPAGLMPGVSESARTADLPLALALSLVVLAGWGAVLVSRGRVRRAVCALALGAAVGVVACNAAAPFVLPDHLREQIAASGRTGVSPTGWFVASAVASAVSVASLVVAWRLVPRWPTMSSRYDAPASAPRSAPGSAHAVPAAAEPTQTDLWKALDEGHDPTAPEEHPSP
jgi:uncharacterized membrane protein (TIGR02234 family)